MRIVKQSHTMLVVAEPRFKGQMGTRAVQHCGRGLTHKLAQRRTRKCKCTNLTNRMRLLCVAIFRSTGHAAEANAAFLSKRWYFGRESFNHARMNLTGKNRQNPAGTLQIQMIRHFKRGKND